MIFFLSFSRLRLAFRAINTISVEFNCGKAPGKLISSYNMRMASFLPYKLAQESAILYFVFVFEAHPQKSVTRHGEFLLFAWKEFTISVFLQSGSKSYCKTRISYVNAKLCYPRTIMHWSNKKKRFSIDLNIFAFFQCKSSTKSFLVAKMIYGKNT